ncbi:beta-1,4-glucuronyltransferase 1 isoform X1 [Nilaparvata lugens]|uniref:beta-1,4-glucuronyltransferase 1 isoform X1 n=2 Tax=Nilaparvata lugens TaxID=108931 RepID=UPI00193E4DDE|nr:beta-1,4-glucuronyltransferase 1 isoform X1 [Nilaparvata lugens]
MFGTPFLSNGSSKTMLTRRNWVLRFSIVLNLVVLFYFGTHIASKNGGMDIIEELQQSGRELAAMEEEMAVEGGRRLNGVQSMPSAAALVLHTSPQQGTTSQSTSDKRQTRVSTTAASTTERKETSSGGSSAAAGAGTVSALPQAEATLEQLIPCHDRDAQPFTAQRGDFWVLYNYVTAAARRPHCWESITYTTHADYTFLDNLQPLLERWRGPVSLALYAPGTDFAQTLNTIRYLKDCGSDLVNEFVTFHIYFPSKHIPKQIPRGEAILGGGGESTNCSLPAPWLNQTGALYKTRKKLLYPVNVGRNIAREAATTHFVLPSDIELYPSPGLIPEFLAMVLRQEPPLLRKNPKVFVLSIFELESNMNLPVNKNELVSMVRNGSAISFHKKVCPGCHNVPKSKEWLSAASSGDTMRVFHIGKRTGYFVHWEPIFIGTNHDPFYDERLSWEGKSDKMTQGYTLCVLDYEFHILDSAFLVHKPGIKTLKKDPARAALSAKSNALISRVIFPELKVLYGTRRGCAV